MFQYKVAPVMPTKRAFPIRGACLSKRCLDTPVNSINAAPEFTLVMNCLPRKR
jgi:hypothetical protein